MVSIKNTAYRLLRFIKTYSTLFKQLVILQFIKKTESQKIALILITKKRAYVLMGLICISSFLFYNREYRVEIYCDKKLLKFIRFISTLLRNFDIRINPDIDNNADPYLEQLKLFFKLKNKKTILIDADIRWLGKLTYDFKFPLAYNLENDETSLDFWQIFNSYLKFPPVSEYKVYTCCITSWGETELKFEYTEIDKLIDLIENFPWDQSRSRIPYYRLRGQFIMSYFLINLGRLPITIIDLENESKILETSFYGATGYRFGK